MNPGAKILLIVSLLLAGALAIYLAMTSGNEHVTPYVPEQQLPDDPPEVAPPTPKVVEVAEPGANQTRTEVTQLTPSGDDFAQGIRGRVVADGGTPLPGIDVFLVEGQGTDIFTMMLMQQRGVVIPPVAHAESDDAGMFVVGLQKVVADKKYELRFVSDQFADHAMQNLTIFEDKWVEVGDVELKRGVTVHGQVTVQGTGGLPVPEATVSVQVTNAFPSISPTPGRERGITTTTDNGGFFRLSNVGAGMVTVSAVAPGYAKVERANVQVAGETDNQVNFELPKGMSIAGVVIDGEGNAVPGAKVTAIAISSKTPLTADTRTSERGQFEIIGLIEGPYQINAVAQGFVEKPVKPVFAGEQDERIVLERQGGARVKVVTKGGRLLTRYDVLLKTYFKDQDSYGNVMSMQVQRVYPANLADGFYLVSGMDPGSYVFEVNAQGYAKTFSEPFMIALGGDEPEVIVAMNQGGEVRGTVTGYDGRPLSGVTVVTLPNFLDENPFTAMFGAMIPYKITRTWTTTDSQGRYSIKLLAPGEYQLKFTHPQHYDVYQKGYMIEEARATDIPALRMDRGTIVSGTARVDGVPAGQVKVTVSSVVDPTQPVQVNFNAEAITDNEGKFVIQKRLPPGKYQARAARQTLPSPLLQVVDFAKTQQDFTIMRGQESFTLHFDMTSD